MKKRILLALLPAAMALAACSGIQSSPKQANLMLEDTVAHEEVFGAAEELGNLRFVKKNPYRAQFASDFIKMGYQIQFDAHGEGDADDTISIRFVAALKNSNVEAYWHRGFAQPNSYEGAYVNESWKFKLTDEGKESLKIYSSLTNGNTSISAGAGDYADYEGFIVYTLTNIPYETYKESYLGAYVEIVDPNGELDTKKSDFAVIKVEKQDANQSKNAFTVPAAKFGKHFLQGTINGEPTIVFEDETILEDDKNFASYKDLTLLADDYFGSYYLSTTSFQFFGHDFFAESVDLFDESDVLAEYVSPKAAGTHTLFISKGDGHVNHVYSTKDGVSKTFTINSIPSWVGDNNATVFAWVVRSNHVGYWAETSYASHDESLTFSAPDNISLVVLARFAEGTLVSQASWENVYYNKSADISIDSKSEYNGSSWIDA